MLLPDAEGEPQPGLGIGVGGSASLAPGRSAGEGLLLKQTEKEVRRGTLSTQQLTGKVAPSGYFNRVAGALCHRGLGSRGDQQHVPTKC